MTAEVPATAVGGAVLAAATAGAVGLGRSGMVVAGLVGAVSGGVAGAHRVYDWRSTRGRVAFGLDHTWALITTTTGVLAMGLNRVLGESGPDVELTERRNRLVNHGGFVLRKGFAVTFGYVVNGAAMPDGRMTEARRRLVERHEDVHVWQARLLGPIYALGYVGWSGVGALAGALSWLFDRRRSPFVRRIDAFAYYRNPFEWHAYSRDGNWPPRGVDSSLVWRRRFDEAFRGCGGNRAERS